MVCQGMIHSRQLHIVPQANASLADIQKAQICPFGPTEHSARPNAEIKTHGFSDAGHILPPLFLGFQLGVFVGGIHSLVNRLPPFPIGPAIRKPLAIGGSCNFNRRSSYSAPAMQ
jgi:hypothetical protein